MSWGTQKEMKWSTQKKSLNTSKKQGIYENKKNKKILYLETFFQISVDFE